MSEPDDVIVGPEVDELIGGPGPLRLVRHGMARVHRPRIHEDVVDEPGVGVIAGEHGLRDGRTATTFGVGHDGHLRPVGFSRCSGPIVTYRARAWVTLRTIGQ